MKYYTKLILSAIILLTVTSISLKAQTNVSGGIYSNATWTKAKSPYIVTDTVVVFPGVTLTIEAGVTVKFDNNIQLEIRQASLIAIGTLSDSITFTSNALAPTPGIWDAIYLNGGAMSAQFNYCNFRYATNGIWIYSDSTLIVQNSNFNFNLNGASSQPFLFGGSTIRVDSCNFRNNTDYGIDVGEVEAHYDVNIYQCNFFNNGTGLSATGLIKNCVMDSNNTGAYINNGTVDSCHFKYNQIGINYGNTSVSNCLIDSNIVTGISAFEGSVNNCEIKYNGLGVQVTAAQIIQNDIEHNGINIQNFYAGYYVGTTIARNIIEYGSIGIDSVFENDFVITQNIIENNSIGIVLYSTNSTIYCNRICNNSSYALKYGKNVNISIGSNYWCTNDSATVASAIYDGYDDISLGLVSFMPVDTVSCYLNTTCSANFSLYADTSQLHHYIAINNASGTPPLSYHWNWGDGSYEDTAAYPSHVYADSGYYTICLTIVDLSDCISTYCDTSFHVMRTTNYMVYVNVIPLLLTGIINGASEQQPFLKIYPNPVGNNLTLYIPDNASKGTIKIFNLLGEMTYSSAITKQKTDLDISSLPKGIYIIEAAYGNAINRKKFVKE